MDKLTEVIPIAVPAEDWEEVGEELDDTFLGDAQLTRRPTVGTADPRGVRGGQSGQGGISGGNLVLCLLRWNEFGEGVSAVCFGLRWGGVRWQRSDRAADGDGEREGCEDCAHALSCVLVVAQGDDPYESPEGHNILDLEFGAQRKPTTQLSLLHPRPLASSASSRRRHPLAFPRPLRRLENPHTPLMRDVPHSSVSLIACPSAADDGYRIDGELVSPGEIQKGIEGVDGVVVRAPTLHPAHPDRLPTLHPLCSDMAAHHQTDRRLRNGGFSCAAHAAEQGEMAPGCLLRFAWRRKCGREYAERPLLRFRSSSRHQAHGLFVRKAYVAVRAPVRDTSFTSASHAARSLRRRRAIPMSWASAVH